VAENAPPPQQQPQQQQAYQPQQQAYQPQEQTYQSQPTYKRQAPSDYGRPGVSGGFFDMFVGGASGTMDLTFRNDFNPIHNWELDFINTAATFRKVTFTKLQTTPVTLPVGFRVGGFGKVFGGDVEFSYISRQVKAQSATAAFNDGAPGSFDINLKDYFKVSVFSFSGDLLMRLSNSAVQPYLGVGLGLTLNRVYSPYIYQFDTAGTFGKPLDDFGLGFTFRIPIGMRIKMGDAVSLYGEYRFVLNTFTFDRGIKNEQDSVTMNMGQAVMGLGFLF
jgi:hypothetical protein